MNRMRAFSFPRVNVSKHQDESMSECEISPTTPAHSRNSSGASTASSPITSTFSPGRSHNRWPSSSSSLASAPDSPVNLTRSALHDLVEDPAERDDGLYDLPSHSPNEPLCICDTPFCEHRRSISHSATLTPVSPEWTPGDDCFSDGELPVLRSPKRRRSGAESSESLTQRLSRRWPSLSKRWRDPKPTTSASQITVRSAPPSRPASMRRSLAQPTTPPFTPTESQAFENEFTRARALSRSNKPTDIMVPTPAEDPVDRQMASTPLLPPMKPGEHNREVYSPLQSPKVAAVCATASTPTQGGMPTPPLSSKPSQSSFQVARSALALHPSSEIPPMAISEETDEWAIKLGHANFHIQPEPYLPEVCDLQACKKLLDDWEAARMEYMRQVARVSEHYGPTSQIYKFTEQKWAAIDSQWRSLHERANAEAGASTHDTYYQPLAETQPLSKMPSLNDPQQPSKFLNIEEADIVGPMVKYAKIQRRPSSRPAFLKLFTDPASLLGGGRTAFNLRR